MKKKKYLDADHYDVEGKKSIDTYWNITPNSLRKLNMFLKRHKY